MVGNIVVIGSSNTDMIVQTPWIPKPGETILGGTFSTAAGGKGANQAVAAARAGGNVSLIARVGTDMFGDQAVEGFRRDGIDTEGVLRDETAPSGVALIIVDEQGENSIAVAPGANALLTPNDIHSMKDTLTSASVILMQLEIPLETVAAAAEIGAAAGVPVILNPAPAQKLDNNLMRNISLLTPNETEAELLTGMPTSTDDEIARAATHLRELGPDSVIITLGGRGSYVSSDEFTGIIPAFPVKPVDTTAAGDVFNGVLSVRLATGAPITEAVRYASAAAALSVMKLGAQTSAPTSSDIEKMLAKQPS